MCIKNDSMKRIIRWIKKSRERFGIMYLIIDGAAFIFFVGILPLIISAGIGVLVAWGIFSIIP